MEDTDKELRKELAVVTEVLQQRPQWENNPPDYRKLQENAELIRQKFVERVEAAERARDTAHIALSKARELRIGTEASLSEAARLVRSLTNTLKDLTKDGKTDAERQNELGEFALKWDAAKAGLQKVQKTLATFESDRGLDMENLAKLQRSAENTAKEALAEEKKAEGKLEQLSSQGTYSALAEIEEQVAFLRDELANEELNVYAAALLHTVCEECRREMVAQISEPVERTASEILRRIAGGRLGTIQLGEAFEPIAVLPEAIGQPVAIENASGGEKEQIYIAIRLALAKVLAQGERQLVVLDDVLTSTDSGRLARVLRVLGEAAQHLQIVILTCHPERYGALDQAKLFDLESLGKR
ncbi:MAG: hypothetical protein HW397_293 [Dehalococcoidia bacterium]|nr:hypothetical protein [Dehalococcoidia bacterium]